MKTVQNVWTVSQTQNIGNCLNTFSVAFTKDNLFSDLCDIVILSHVLEFQILTKHLLYKVPQVPEVRIG